MKIFKIFYKENDIEEKEIKVPQDYRYLKLLRFNLLILNAWPGKELGEKVSKFGVLITAANIFLKLFYFINGGLYLRNNMERLTFYEMGHAIIILLMSFVGLTRIFMIALSQKCKSIFVTYLTKMHLLHFKGFSNHALKIHKRLHMISHMYTLWLIGQFWIGLTFFTLTPIYRNYVAGNYKHRSLLNSTYEHTIYLELPFDTTTNFNGYLFASFLNLLDAYICCSWFIMLDLLLCLIVFQLWGHYKILLHELDSFPLPDNKKVLIIDNKKEKVDAAMYTEDELKAVSKKLIRCIDYHRLIADFTNNISEGYGPMLFIYYAFHQACGCLLLLECSQMTPQALLVYGILTVIVFQQLIQLSVIFELLGSTSEKLKDAIYGVPWECMDVKNRKIVAIFLTNVQEPIHVKALGLARVGVTTMATIIKTSLTYFTFLQSIGNGT